MQVEEQGTHKSKGARHILQVLLTPGTMVVRGKEGAIDEIRFKDILRCEPHESTDGEPTALRLQVRHLFRASQPDLHAHPLQRLDVDPSSLRGVETLSLGSVPSVAAAPVLYTLSLSLFVLLTSRLAPEKPNRHGGRRGGRAAQVGKTLHLLTYSTGSHVSCRWRRCPPLAAGPAAHPRGTARRPPRGWSSSPSRRSSSPACATCPPTACAAPRPTSAGWTIACYAAVRYLPSIMSLSSPISFLRPERASQNVQNVLAPRGVCIYAGTPR